MSKMLLLVLKKERFLLTVVVDYLRWGDAEAQKEQGKAENRIGCMHHVGWRFIF